MRKFTHELIEKNVGLLLVLVILVVSVGGLVEIVPLFFQKSTTQPVERSEERRVGKECRL